MTKCLMGVLVGVFLGAFALEMLQRKKPGLLARIRERARYAASDFRHAFADGYRSAVPGDVRPPAPL